MRERSVLFVYCTCIIKSGFQNTGIEYTDVIKNIFFVLLYSQSVRNTKMLVRAMNSTHPLRGGVCRGGVEEPNTSPHGG